MHKQSDWIDAFLCLIFGISSMGGWFWMYWHIALPV